MHILMKKIFGLTILIAFSLFSTGFVTTVPANAVSKSLVYPVAGKRSSVGSYWGAVRDGGKRKHQGIDIFARKGTPVVAICDGIISSRGTTPRGGKILWLNAAKYGWSAYYAHLDKQFVKEGQYVKKGQVLGTVGNTGNAKTTPAHLHFGIYTWKGAVNPLPYVKASPKIAAPKIPQTTKKSTAKSSKKKMPAKRK
jgi:murein DD-endopeptidase MepM/ murein hydrolase activator NlpD